jgi:alcohol dehydrogenase
MALMRRQSLVKFDAPLCETIVDTPKPQGREVLVRIERCGLCHSDLHIQDGYADLGRRQKARHHARHDAAVHARPRDRRRRR